jgi:uncharacterized protein (DUF169 family)
MIVNDYSVLNKIAFDLPPIGVKFSFFRPEGIAPLEKEAQLSLCEILKTAQAENRSFYFSKENSETCIGKVLLGMDEFPPFAESGEIGLRLGVFEDPRCNKNLYQYVPRHKKGTVNYVLFSPAGKLTYEPDVLVISATPDQAEIVMRAMTYSTGEMYKSLCTPVMGCAWMLVHPYMTGQVNFIVPAIVHGMHDRRLYPSDTLIISIPYRWIPTILSNLRRMPLQLEGHKSKAAYFAQFEGILADLSEKAENP